jgi:hypothetical protein
MIVKAALLRKIHVFHKIFFSAGCRPLSAENGGLIERKKERIITIEASTRSSFIFKSV